MRLAHAVFCTVLLSLPFAAVAKKEKASKPQQFIERSVIVYPNAVPGLTFAEKKYDAQSWSAGVSLRYELTAAPEVVLDVYVYPLGRAPAGPTLDGEIKAVGDAVREAGKQAIYSSVVIGTPEPFDIGAPVVATDASDVSPATPTAAVNSEPAAKATNPALQAFITETLAKGPIPGRKLVMGFDHSGRPKQSLGYVFNKQLFLLKVRITADTATMNPLQFNDLADAAAREIIPAIQVHNVGDCGITHVRAEDMTDDDMANARFLITDLARLQRESCVSSADKIDAVPGTGQETIVFPPDTWKSN